MNFTELGLRPELIRAVTEMGFETPMPIQEQAIPVLLAGDTDFVGLAQTGTGKTGAYGLSLLQRVDSARRTPQVLILCPTRELCLQITNELRQFGRYLKSFHVVAVYGGASMSTQISEIRHGVQVVVATPGRLCDLMRRKAIDFTGVSVSVLDEADEMLNMGFQEDLDTILDALPEAARTWLFSATMPQGVAAISRKYLSKPVEITVGKRNQSAANLTHVVFLLQHAHRYVALKRLLDSEASLFGLVFRRTRREAQELSEALTRDGYPAESLHGDLSQAQRDSVMRGFRRRQMCLLVATDVAARGLDVEDITHVIHYDLPADLDVYTHRSGRTARAGKSGVSWVFASPAERYRLKLLERNLRIEFTVGKVPDGREACRRRLLDMAAKLAATEVHPSALADYLPPVAAAFESLSKEDLVARLVAAEIKRYHATHGTATDVNAAADSASRPSGPGMRPARGPGGRRQDDGLMRRFEVDIGRRDRANEGAIVRVVCECAGIASSMIGRIVLDENSACFEVQEPVAEQVLKGLRAAFFDGRPVRVRDAADGGGGGGGHRDDPRKHRPAPFGHRPYPHTGRRGRV
jgi:ATP-dependent RNA helicase DeaD